MPAPSPWEKRTTNGFAASFTVAMVLTAGFFAAVTGITITSACVAVTGLILLICGLGLYGLLLV